MELDGWVIHQVGERVDSFNQGDFKSAVEKVLESGAQKVAFDLHHTKFLSFACIKMITGWADQLRARGGQAMLLGISEKLKRQIYIYGSLDHLIVSKPQVTDSTELRAAESPERDGTLDF